MTINGNNARAKVLLVSLDFLTELLRPGGGFPADAKVEGLPADARIMDIQFDRHTGNAAFIFTSDSFLIAEAGWAMPTFDIQVSAA